MKILRKTLLITLSFLMFISCRKQKLEGDAALLIGKWKAIKYVNAPMYFGDCTSPIDKIDNCLSKTIEFKKNRGKVITTDEGEKIKYFVKIENEEEDVSEIKDFRYFHGCNTRRLDSIDSYFKIKPTIETVEIKAEENYEVYYYLNNEKLIIFTDRYTEYYKDYDGWYYFVYERVD